MITFDTETSQDNENKIVYIDLCVFYNGAEYKVFDKKNFKTQLEMKHEIIDYIYNVNENLFVAHNLEYDLNSIFYPYYLKELELFYNNNLIYATLKNTRKKFIDSFNFSFTSLKTIGEQIKIKKMEVAGNFYNVEYCKIDCKIVYEYMKQFTDSVYDEFELKIKNTLAGTSQNIFLKRFDNFKVGGLNTNGELLNFYYGGRTECFNVGFIKKPVYCIDINSSYPASMYNYCYPVVNYSDCLNIDSVDNLNWLAEVDVEIDDCYLPVIPYRTDKLLFPTGKFKTYITSVEYNKAVELDQIKNIKFNKIYSFNESAYLFRDFIQYFYDKRQLAKESNNNFLSSFYKLIMNSTYGRFALHGGMKVLKEHTNESGYIELLSNDELIYKNVTFEKSETVNYALPCFITANSRIHLYNLLKNIMIMGGNILYSDTDSCYFTISENVEQDIKQIENNFAINNNLGCYSLEVYKAMDIYNVKAYVLYYFDDDIKTVCKGIPKDYRIEYLQTGQTNYLKPMKLRNSLRSVDKIPANYWYNLFISQKGEYKKRKKIPTGSGKKFYNTIPVKL